LLASIAAVELCGPCRFGGWDTALNPVAVQHPAPWIQIAAVSQDQTRNTMTLFPGLFTKDALREYRVDIGKTIIYARGVGRVEAVTSSPQALEGGRPSLAVLNESQEWLSNNEGSAMAKTIRRNLAKSNDGSARSMEICNAHLPGEESVAEETFEAVQKANGDIPGLLYDSLEAPPIRELTDLDTVRAGLIAARGDSTWLNVDRLLDEIADPVTPEYMSRRYYLNQVVAVEGERWMPMELWDARVHDPSEYKIPDHAECVLAFDGSFSGDSTAIIAVELGVTPHVAVVACWENASTDPDWRVPIEDVEETLRAACKRLQVREIAADAYRWARSLEILANEGLPVVEFPQRPARMIPATTRLYEAVCNGGMTHDGNPDLRRHVSNAVLRVSTQGGHLSKDAKTSPRKIDLAVTAVMGFERAMQYQPGEPRVWDLRDYA
jgi:phage terminase large subunit-like protein